MSHPGDIVACRVCRTGLDVYSFPDKPTEYKHSETVIHQYGSAITDHEPDPVLGLEQLDIIGVCDFCGAKHPRYSYPCSSFEVGNIGDTGMGMIADWAACHVCHALIEHDQWDLIARRSADQFPADMYMAAQLAVRHLHRLFREHRTGPAVDLVGLDGSSTPAHVQATPPAS